MHRLLVRACLARSQCNHLAGLRWHPSRCATKPSTCPTTGLRLRYLEWGSGGRDVVLLLHDCGEAADIWRPIGPRLADRGYRVIAPDLRGELPFVLLVLLFVGQH